MGSAGMKDSLNDGSKPIPLCRKNLLEGVEAVLHNLEAQAHNQTTDQGILEIDLFEQEEDQKNNQTFSNFFVDGSSNSSPPGLNKGLRWFDNEQPNAIPEISPWKLLRLSSDQNCEKVHREKAIKFETMVHNGILNIF